MKCPDQMKLSKYYESGAAEDFEAFVLNSEPWIFKRALYLIRGSMAGRFELAEDITWTVIQKIEASRRKNPWLPDKGALSGWMHRIIRNQVVGHFRSKSSQLLPCSDCLPESQEGKQYSMEHFKEDHRNALPLEVILHQELLEEVRKVLEQFPPQTQQVYSLYYEQGLNFRNIAKQVGSNTTAVYRQVAAVRAKLVRLTASGKLAA
jgi:RNA polymerase sigma factor (sigma-70 family)